MRQARAVAFLVVASIVLVVAGALKAHRYGQRSGGSADAVLAEARAALGPHGWRQERQLTFAPGLSLSAALLVREGCPRPLAVATVGESPELVAYLRLAVGEGVDLLLLEGGPSDTAGVPSLRRWWETVLRGTDPARAAQSATPAMRSTTAGGCAVVGTLANLVEGRIKPTSR